MPKQKTPNVPTLNRKRLVGLQREQFINRILLIGTLVIVAVVLGLVGWGSLNQFIIGPNAPVAVVAGQEILGKEFQALVKINRNQLVNNYIQYVQTLQFFGNDPTFQQQAFAQLQQIQYQLIPEVVGEQTINQMVDDQLLKLEAAELGIVVSQEEIEKEFQGFMGYFPSGTPTSVIVDTPIATSTFSSTQLAIVTITNTPPPSPTATSTLINLSSPSPIPTHIVINTPPAPFTPTPGATSTPYTEEGYATAAAAYFTSQEEGLGLTQEAIYEIIYMNLLRDAISVYLSEDVTHTQEQVWARHILVADEAAAQAAIARLEAGADFGALVREISEDEGTVPTGGDLGWFNFEAMVEPFAAAAFELQIGEISEPVQSDFGFHVIQVLGHEERPLNQEEYNAKVQQALTDFITGLREKYDWEIFENWKAIVPTEPRIPPQYSLQ
ncbi:MAG: peptidylprolyl isomerase [Anaerolineales bacterium]